MVIVLVFIAVALVLLALAAMSVAGTAAEILAVNKQFLPVEQPGVRLAEGDVLVVRGFGVEQACTVTASGFAVDGTTVVAVEPVGAHMPHA